VTIKKPLRSFEQRFEDSCLRLHAFCTVFEGDQAVQYQSRKDSITDFPSRQRGSPLSRRKVVTEITIETHQVLVIERRQVTRSRWSGCTREADFGPIDKVNVPAAETRNRQGVEAFPSTPHFAGAADRYYTLSLRFRRGATTLAKRFRNFLRRGSECDSQTPK
jgi:hypothetical protein